jgi:pyridoxamine 5'-phosphate oxidase
MTDPVDVAQRREAYHRDGLRRHDLDADPMVVFEAWYSEWLATGPYDGTAVVVATADGSGRPSARFVLLKGYDERGFVFYTNGSSRKGVELHDNPQAALCFGFIPLNRQIRVVGDVEPVSAAESDAYFASRPRASQENAWASAQSQPVPDRAALEAAASAAAERFAGGEVARPEEWGGYRVVPTEIEFWQGRPDRLHDRFTYLRPSRGAPWRLERLQP